MAQCKSTSILPFATPSVWCYFLEKKMSDIFKENNCVNIFSYTHHNVSTKLATITLYFDCTLFSMYCICHCFVFFFFPWMLLTIHHCYSAPWLKWSQLGQHLFHFINHNLSFFPPPLYFIHINSQLLKFISLCIL